MARNKKTRKRCHEPDDDDGSHGDADKHHVLPCSESPSCASLYSYRQVVTNHGHVQESPHGKKVRRVRMPMLPPPSSSSSSAPTTMSSSSSSNNMHRQGAAEQAQALAPPSTRLALAVIDNDHHPSNNVVRVRTNQKNHPFFRLLSDDLLCHIFEFVLCERSVQDGHQQEHALVGQSHHHRRRRRRRLANYYIRNLSAVSTRWQAVIGVQVMNSHLCTTTTATSTTNTTATTTTDAASSSNSRITNHLHHVRLPRLQPPPPLPQQYTLGSILEPHDLFALKCRAMSLNLSPVAPIFTERLVRDFGDKHLLIDVLCAADDTGTSTATTSTGTGTGTGTSGQQERQQQRKNALDIVVQHFGSIMAAGCAAGGSLVLVGDYCEYNEQQYYNDDDQQQHVVAAFCNLVATEYVKFLVVKCVELYTSNRAYAHASHDIQLWKDEPCVPPHVVELFWQSHLMLPKHYAWTCHVLLQDLMGSSSLMTKRHAGQQELGKGNTTMEFMISMDHIIDHDIEASSNNCTFSSRDCNRMEGSDYESKRDVLFHYEKQLPRDDLYLGRFGDHGSTENNELLFSEHFDVCQVAMDIWNDTQGFDGEEDDCV